MGYTYIPLLDGFDYIERILIASIANCDIFYGGYLDKTSQLRLPSREPRPFTSSTLTEKKMKDIRIRSVKDRDIESVGQCLYLATKATSNDDGTTSTKSTIQESSSLESLRRLAESSQTSSSSSSSPLFSNEICFLVAVFDEEAEEERNKSKDHDYGHHDDVLGFLIMKRWYQHLSMLFVRPDIQRQGVGRQLWEEAIRLAMISWSTSTSPSKTTVKLNTTTSINTTTTTTDPREITVHASPMQSHSIRSWDSISMENHSKNTIKY